MAATPSYDQKYKAMPNSELSGFSAKTGQQANKYLGGNALQSPYNINRFAGLTDDIKGNLFGANSPWKNMGGGGSSGSGWWTSSAGPNDPNTSAFINELRGGMRNATDDNARRVAMAGPTRAGMNTVGGPAASSVLAKSGMDNIARLYPEIYDQAHGYSNQMYAGAGENFRSMLGALTGLANTELGAQQGQAGFLTNQANIGVQLNSQDLAAKQAMEQFLQNKYFDDTNYARGEEGRQWARDDRAIAQSNRMNRPVDPSGQIPTLESVIAQYNTRFPYGDSTNMVKKSDLLAKLQGVGPYGSSGGGGGGQKKTSNYVSSADSDFMNIDRSTNQQTQFGGRGNSGHYYSPITGGTYRGDA